MNTDPFGRTIDYLRISVTDRCNERCLYCMPEGYKGWALKPDHMTADEVVRAVETAAGLGFRKFRLTGGEPLIRPDLVGIAERIWNLPGVESLGLSTNGTRLADLARPLRQAGVRSLNVSLDALDDATYQRLTGGRVESVLQGLEAARRKASNASSSIPFSCAGRTRPNCRASWNMPPPMGIRCVSSNSCPFRGKRDGRSPRFCPSPKPCACSGGRGDFTPAPDTRIGHGPASYYRHEPTGAVVGFIGALTKVDFCSACNKLRLTADGKLRPCLGRHGEVDLLPALRSNDLAAARGQFLACLSGKPKDHEFNTTYEPGRPMVAIGG
ncbi:MAG: radical SAM protein [Blastochloris sp.]|nr:radical SAM protein [Blastochloris sp.]